MMSKVPLYNPAGGDAKTEGQRDVLPGLFLQELGGAWNGLPLPNGQDFFLAYSESVGAVDYMIKTYGKEALVTLIRSYAQGRTDDEAFSAALGVDMTAFGEAWFKDVNAKAPTRYGPQPAPAGPVPAAWAGAVSGGSSPAPGASDAAPVPGATASAAPAAIPTGSAGPDAGILVLVIVVVAVFAVAVGVARRRRNMTDAAG